MTNADFHLHTLCSDGSLTPVELEKELEGRGVKYAAFTDHDRVTNLQSSGRVRFVSGIELSTYRGESEIHLLGYGFDIESPVLGGILSRIAEVRKERFFRMVEKASSMGLVSGDIPDEYMNAEVPGRYHMARLLCRQNAVSGIRDAFIRYLGEGCPLYEPVELLDTLDGLKLLKEAGAFVSYAHPARTNKDEIIASLVKEGLDGIEAYYPFHDPVMVRHYLKLGEKYRIIPTGGSDYHKGRYKYEMSSDLVSDFISLHFD